MMLRRIRGFTLVEMVVTLTLTTLLGIMVLQALNTSSDRAAENIMHTQAQTAARETVDELRSALSSAHRALQCQGGNESSADCRNFQAGSTSVLYATGQCIVFRSYSRVVSAAAWAAPHSAPKSSSEPLRGAELVVARGVTVQGSPTLVVNRYENASIKQSSTSLTDISKLCDSSVLKPQWRVSSTNSTLQSPIVTKYVDRPLASSVNEIFNYCNTSGVPLVAGSGDCSGNRVKGSSVALTQAQLSDVAVVGVSASFDQSKKRTSSSSTSTRNLMDLKLSVVLSGAGYSE